MSNQKRLKVLVWLATFGLVFSFLGSIRPLNLAKNLKSEGYSPFKLIESSLTLEVYAEEVSSFEVDYYLPYPGILPDSPFYWVKMARDRVQLWLTPSPLKKAEKLLLYADKRLGAGYSLVDGGKERLGVSTLTKAEKYLERAGEKRERFGESEEEKIFEDKFLKARLKHEQVLRLAFVKVGDREREVVEKMILVFNEVN